MAASKKKSTTGAEGAPQPSLPAKAKAAPKAAKPAAAPKAPKAAASKTAAPKAAAPKPAPAAAAKAASAAPGAPSRLMWLVPVAMLLLLAGVGVSLYLHARYLASLKFDMVREARTVPQGHDRGQCTGLTNLAGDKNGQIFVLESNGGDFTRLQRFDRQSSADSLVYDDTKKDHDLKWGVDVDVDAQGMVYVLLTDGRIQVLNNDLKYQRTIRTGILGARAASVNSAGRVYVADQQANKVVYFDAKGQREGEFGAPGTGAAILVSPVDLRVTQEDEVVVIENTETGLRGRIFSKDLSLRKTFLVDKIQNSPPVRLGVNGQDKAFFNDPQGTRGIVCWDLKTGNYFGESQSTKDGEQFVSPGCIGADRFTASVYVHTVTGLIKCELPTPGGDK